MISAIRGLVRDVKHGLTLKFFALVSRIAFLFIVTPRLLSGELSKYVFLATIAILAGRLISMGMDEQLPLRVAGKIEVARIFAPLVGATVLLECILALMFAISRDDIVVTMLLAVCYVTTSLFVGLVRSVNLEAAERLRDLHWVAFVLLCLLPATWSAEDLLALMAASLMAIHLLELRISGVKLDFGSVHWQSLASETSKQLQSAWKKLLSSVSVLLMVRAIILWPNIFALAEQLDDIAYALLIGEAFLQTSMVLVYRRYAKYCVGLGSVRETQRDIISALIVLLGYAFLVSCGVQVFNLLDLEIGRFSNWTSVSVFIIFFGLISGYLLLRYLTWALVNFEWRLLGLEIIFVLSQGFIVFFFPVDYWIAITALSAAIFVAISLAYVWVLVRETGSAGQAQA